MRQGGAIAYDPPLRVSQWRSVIRPNAASLLPASYEARSFGIRSAMPSTVATRKCAELVFVPPRFDVYREVSKQEGELGPAISRVCDSIWAAGWLHSADRNPWTRIAEAAGFAIDRRAPAWGQQYQDIGFSRTDQAEARRAFAAWEQRMESTPPASDSAADALEPEGEWNAYLQADKRLHERRWIGADLGRRLYCL